MTGSLRGGALAALLTALTFPAAAGAAVLPANSTSVISGTPDLLSLFATPADNAEASGQSVSGDGLRVAFTSASDGLVAGDDDSVRNVYVRSRDTGAVELASRASDGQPSHGDCEAAAISDDGTSVAFACRASLDPLDPDAQSDVYVRNLRTQQTTLVSRPDGFGSNDVSGDSFAPTIDASGRFVAFTSEADLVPEPNGSAFRIYRRDLLTGATVLVSRGVDNAPSTRDAVSPSISNDGDRVAFDTSSQLSPVDPNTARDVYVRFVQQGTTELVSRRDVGDGGAAANAGGGDAAISGNGLFVVFTSGSTNLDPFRDNDTKSDVYLRSLNVQTTRLISVSGTVKQNGSAFAVGVDDTGAVVSFTTTATNLDPADGETGLDAYLLRQGVAQLVSRGDGAGAASNAAELDPAVSGNGTVVAMNLREPLTPDTEPGKRVVAVRDLLANTTRTVSRSPGGEPFVNVGGDARGGSVSADGRFVAFLSDAPALGVPRDVDAWAFVRDLETGSVTLVGREDGFDGAPLASLGDPKISGDGRRVVLETFEPTRRILVRDIAQGRTLAADVPDGPAAAAPPPNGESSEPSISDDGRRVAFLSTTTNLTPEDADAQGDVFVRDFAAERTFLVDRADGLTGAKANSPALAPALSGDGRSVAFATRASNLTGSDGDGVLDVHVRNIDAGRTQLASVAGAATKGDGDSDLPSISRDGNRVSFVSSAANFVADPPGEKLYVRDLAARTLTVVSRADGPAGAIFSDGARRSAISGDGNHVAFVAAPDETSIAPGDPADEQERAFERDLTTGTTRLLSRRSGADGAPSDGDDGVDIGGITADGGCVTFTTGNGVLPAVTPRDFSEVYLRAVTLNCGRPVPPAPPGPPLPPPPGPVAKAAVLSGLKLKPARFHVGGRKGGTKILFRLDTRSAVSLRFDHLLAGHKAKGKRCSVKVRKGRRCTVARVAGRLMVAASRTRSGANTIAFSGKLGRKALKPGRYRLTATPLRGTARTVSFVVVKAPKVKPTQRKARR